MEANKMAMDCIQAESAMMEQMEKTIQPARARDLAQHLLTCETCREYYTGFDMAFDVLSDPELSEAPANFTHNIMTQVRKLPVCTPPEPSASTAMRVMWGFGAIFLGVALLFAFNPEWWQALTASSAVYDSILAAMGAASLFVTDALERLMSVNQAAGGFAGLSVVNIALVFVFVVGALLFVLQRSEKSYKA